LQFAVQYAKHLKSETTNEPVHLLLKLSIWLVGIKFVKYQWYMPCWLQFGEIFADSGWNGTKIAYYTDEGTKE